MTVLVVVLVCVFTLILSINVYHWVFASEDRLYDEVFATELDSVTQVHGLTGDLER